MTTVGQRVELLVDVERYPFFMAPAGATGVVVEVSPDVIGVRLDAPLAGAEEWDNVVQWECEDRDAFMRECRAV
jgi:hypothetical protein